jgi:transcriptional antiterminator RfaH
MALQEQFDLTVYVPEVMCYYQGQVQRAPLFPRYLFAQIDLHTVPPSRINATPGVTRLVTFDTTPQKIPAAVVQAIHTQVERCNEQGGLPEHGFQPGDTVQFRRGPLRGLEAIFVGPVTPSQRVRILLEFMGRLNELEVDRNLLETRNRDALPKRERRTRGRGRKIKNTP